MPEEAAYPGEREGVSNPCPGPVPAPDYLTPTWGVEFGLSAPKATTQPICLGWPKATARPRSVLLQEPVFGRLCNYSNERGRVAILK